MDDKLYIIDIYSGNTNDLNQSSNGGIDLLVYVPLFIYGVSQIYENSDHIYSLSKTSSSKVYNYISNLWNTSCAWAMGIRRFNKNGEEVFEELNEEYGKKELNYDGKKIIAEGYYNDDIIRGPGNITIVENGKFIYSRGIYKDNKLHGPGTFTIEHWNNEDEETWIKGVYSGMFRKNNLHGKGKFENKYISVEGEFKDGYLQKGTVIVKKYKPNWMDETYKNRRRITGVFSGKDYLSQTAFVEYLALDTPTSENGEMELIKGGHKVIEKGSFRKGRLYGVCDVRFEINDQIYETKGRYYNGQLMKNRDYSVKNNGVELIKKEIVFPECRSGECGSEDVIFEFVYSNGNKMEVNEDVTEFKVIFGSGDYVKGDIINNTLLKEQIQISKYPKGELNSTEIEIMLPNVTDLVYKKHKERSIEDLNKLEFSYWLYSKDCDLYDKLSDSDGKNFMSIKTIEDSGNLTEECLSRIIELQKDIDEDSEDSEDSIVMVSSVEESSVEE